MIALAKSTYILSVGKKMASSVLTKVRLLSMPLETICQRCIASHSSQPRFPVLKLGQANTDMSDANSQHFRKLEEVLQSALAVAYAGGGPKAIERHTQRNKKMVVEDRVKVLIDEDTPFLELSPLAGFMMEYGTVPRAGLITGGVPAVSTAE